MSTHSTNHGPTHPGVHVRRNVIPKGMTVTKAASLLGVGRPALSNLLNGKAALSQEMALRLQKTFQANREYLLDLQALYDRRDDALRTPVVSGRHAPMLVEIRAKQIEQWSNTNEAREELPVLLRRLVCATGFEATRIDFPAFDNSQRPGWDGIVETATHSPWVPEGLSYWEFGCGQDPGSKANSDYMKRVQKVPLVERLSSVFVFVTPRNWRKKDEWVAEKTGLREWKDVRALDASDLEQWLEQSAETQVWFVERINSPVDGFRSPDMCWSNWANACDPALPPSLFSIAEGSIAELKDWLNVPPKRPFMVAADSPDEALAFACHCVREVKVGAGGNNTNALVFDKPEAMQKFLSTNTAPKIAIIHDSKTEKVIGPLIRCCHCLIVGSASSAGVEAKPDIKLGLPTLKGFSNSLESMGYNDDRIEFLARESGRSPTVLRRRLSNIPAVRNPSWAEEDQIARKLLPTAFVGAWNKNTEPRFSDLDVVSKLAQVDDSRRIEEGIAELLSLPESPLWSAGDYQGVVSRVDALFGIAKFVTKSDLETFFCCAERVFAKRDPALDLPEDKRWAAGKYGKAHIHSIPLRDGISDTLILLSVHGNNLFRKRLGINVESRVSSLIRKLLEPFTIENLLSHNWQLPRYAEAAPEQFLELIELDLRKSEPIVFGLLKPADGPLLSGCPRARILWALECLAWKHLGRVSTILAHMSKVTIDDNWDNTPVASLLGIHLSWMPQTAASLEERLRILEVLTNRFPEIGRRICMKQLESGSQTATPNYRPRWRNDASDAGQVATFGEIDKVKRKVLCLAIERPKHDADSLGDLVEHLGAMHDEDQIAVWNLINRWTKAETDDYAKAKLRERIRWSVLVPSKLSQGMIVSTRKRARSAYEKLKPNDLVARHAWLFTDYPVHLLEDEIDDDLYFDKREERIQDIRSSAIHEIWQARGIDGAMALLFGSRKPHVVGYCLGKNLENKDSLISTLQSCLSAEGEFQTKADQCMEGLLSSVNTEMCYALLETVVDGLDTSQVAQLLRCAPLTHNTWSILDQCDDAIRTQYWQEIVPSRHQLGNINETELNKMIRCLIDSKRPRAAFNSVHFGWPRVETSLLIRLLEDVHTIDAKPNDEFLLEEYDISNALEALDGRPGVTLHQMANLEFSFIEALGKRTRGIPNLERKITESPEFFVNVLAFMFPREDDEVDLPSLQVNNPKRQKELLTPGPRLFNQISYIPGIRKDKKLDIESLQNWVNKARQLCAKHGRTMLGDKYIGRLLSKAPADEDGLWPCKAVCEVLESNASDEIKSGLCDQVYNQRSGFLRAIGDGGAKERALAEKYRYWAKQRRTEFPYVGKILEDIATIYDNIAARVNDRVNVDKRVQY